MQPSKKKKLQSFIQRKSDTFLRGSEFLVLLRLDSCLKRACVTMSCTSKRGASFQIPELFLTRWVLPLLSPILFFPAHSTR